MTYIDIILGIIIIYLAFAGFKRGLVRSLGAIIGIFVAIYVAVNYYVSFSAWLQNTISAFHGSWVNILSFVLVFIIANRLFALLVFMLDKVVSIPILDSLNKLLGALFGLIEGVIVITILLSVLAYFQIAQSVRDNSKIIPYSDKVFSIIKPALPKDLKTAFDIENNINGMSLDEILSYLNMNNKLSQDIIDKIKTQDFKNQNIVDVEQVKQKFEEYLNNQNIE